MRCDRAPFYRSRFVDYPGRRHRRGTSASTTLTIGQKGEHFSKQETPLISGVALTRDNRTTVGKRRAPRAPRALKRAMSRIESPRAVRNRAWLSSFFTVSQQCTVLSPSHSFLSSSRRSPSGSLNYLIPRRTKETRSWWIAVAKRTIAKRIARFDARWCWYCKLEAGISFWETAIYNRFPREKIIAQKNYSVKRSMKENKCVCECVRACGFFFVESQRTRV